MCRDASRMTGEKPFIGILVGKVRPYRHAEAHISQMLAHAMGGLVKLLLGNAWNMPGPNDGWKEHATLLA